MAVRSWRRQKPSERVEHHTEVVREEKLPPGAMERIAALEEECARLRAQAKAIPTLEIQNREAISALQEVLDHLERTNTAVEETRGDVEFIMDHGQALDGNTLKKVG
jgi:hypothetical protein